MPEKTTRTFDELLIRVHKYIQLEDAILAKEVDVVSLVASAVPATPAQNKDEKKSSPSESKRERESSNKNKCKERDERPYTPLTKPPAELLEVVLQKPGVFKPSRANEQPRNPKSDKIYKFHNDHGHDTNEYINLKGAIEKLIQEGHLLEYVRQESENLKKRKKNKNGNKDPKKGKGPRIEEPQHNR